MEKIFKIILDWLRSSPKWVRAVVPFILAALCAIYLLSSCGTVSRVQVDKRTTRHVNDTTHVVVSQSVVKSTLRYRATSSVKGISETLELIPTFGERSEYALP